MARRPGSGGGACGLTPARTASKLKQHKLEKPGTSPLDFAYNIDLSPNGVCRVSGVRGPEVSPDTDKEFLDSVEDAAG
ncbi:hypothetical protein GCM10027160_52570 [Streptomyces calidiresistens]